MEKVELPDGAVKVPGALTNPLVLCTETGLSVRDLGARMYSAYGIARHGKTTTTLVSNEDSFILTLKIRGVA